ncbi:hypothetical protein VZT92_005939 [Zoarces viviparus]|uniref:Uncharacterized protein n=1 Tax=Zoarces viviparus TaxID=48416 RepID=A0AAW1FMS9_ZOAVI
MCHHANTHGTQPYVALNNLRVVAGETAEGVLRRGGVESKPEAIIPLSLLRLQTAQIPQEAYPAAVHSFVSLPRLPVWEKEKSFWYPTSTRLPFGRYKVIC